nr:MAG TPA: hypothetical protein [Caudoviricetes sp.]
MLKHLCKKQKSLGNQGFLNGAASKNRTCDPTLTKAGNRVVTLLFLYCFFVFVLTVAQNLLI